MYTIRTATKADASALGYLHYTCWCETYAGQLDPGYLSKGSAEKSAAIFCATAAGICSWQRKTVPPSAFAVTA